MNPQSLEIPHRILTRRLLLRALRPHDAREMNDAIVESFTDLKPWMHWAKERPTLAQTTEYCRQAAAAFETRTEFRMAMFKRSDQTLLGGAGLVRGDWTVPKFEIGYWLRPACRGHGYVTEAVNALISFARKHLHAHRLEIRTDARNKPSAAVARRAGFKLEGRLRKESRDNENKLRDTLVFARTF